MDENNIPQQNPEQPIEQPSTPQQNIPPQQPYNPTTIPPMAPPPPVPGSRSNKGTVSLVLGIIRLVASFIPYISYICWVLAIVGIVMGVQGRNEIPIGQEGRGMATAGLVVSIIGLCWSVLAIICVICACATIGSLAGTDALNDILNQGIYY